jgi:ribosome-binding protein aMBF1 (putative translation factor)
MPVPMKNHHIEDTIKVIVDGKIKKFIIPHCETPHVLSFIKYVQERNEESVPADEVFKHLDQKYGKVGATIRGCRARDEMTQVELARRLGIHQSHLSAMEHGKRTVGKAMARKLAKIFNTGYRLFL